MSEIKNWHLFTETFGEEYMMHDAVIKRFDLNGDELKGDSGTMSWRG